VTTPFAISNIVDVVNRPSSPSAQQLNTGESHKLNEMPRSPKTPTNDGIKASLAPSTYLDSSPISSAKSSATSSRRARAPTTIRPWTSEELVKLFDAVAKRGAVGGAFDGLIEGRTGASCYSTWK
jgi:hypothetical protein